MESLGNNIEARGVGLNQEGEGCKSVLIWKYEGL